MTVTVNGVLMDFTMRLGRSGEAFFVVYDPDNPEAEADGERVRVRGERRRRAEVTGAASVGMDSPARAEPGSRTSEGSDEETTHPYLRSQASVRRRLGTAADGGDGTEARSPSPEEEDEDGDGGAQVATLDDLKHLAEARGTLKPDPRRARRSPARSRRRSDRVYATGRLAWDERDEPRESLGATGSIGGLLPRGQAPEPRIVPGEDNGWGWLGWRGNKNAAGGGTAGGDRRGGRAGGGGSVSAAAATMPSTSVADPSTPRSVASSASTASEATPFAA